ncbi:MAG TPA: SRPBCC domain-containing protein [Chitinophagaceae bacterium]|nr:SRPBCC domain-containing protein [Chitinophagaceae bacterium]
MTATKLPIVKEVLLDAPPERVWKALTDNNEMKQWYFDLKEFKPEVGFEFRFAVEHEGRNWVHLCRVTEAVPNKRLSYTWRYEGIAGDSLLTFELMPEGSKTRLKLTHSGLETFPTNIPGLAVENFNMGWEHFTVSIKKYVG